MAVHDEPIWDGNGGTLDPAKAPQRDLLVALHVKMDTIVIPALKELQSFQRTQESGEFTEAQKRSVKEIVQRDEDDRIVRRQIKLPYWALIVSIIVLIAQIVYTIPVITGRPLL